jgi:hypothetical protein
MLNMFSSSCTKLELLQARDYYATKVMLVLSAIGFALSLGLLCRAILAGWWRTYAVVFAYFVLVTAHTVAVWLVYWFRPGLYTLYYWISEGLFVALGFGLIWQVYAAVPQRYPGVGQIIRKAAQGIAAAAPLLLVLSVVLSRRGTVTLDVVERNFRALQGVLILIVFGLATYYRIPLSRNLRAVVRGFGLYTAIFIARYTIGPMRFSGVWAYVIPSAYIAAQVIWLRGLWRYENPAAVETKIEAEADAETYSLILRLRQQLQRPFYP